MGYKNYTFQYVPLTKAEQRKRYIKMRNALEKHTFRPPLKRWNPRRLWWLFRHARWNPWQRIHGIPEMIVAQLEDEELP